MTSPLVRLGRLVGAAALSLALLPVIAAAQTVTGNIRGRVLSTDGSPVVSATVMATDPTTSFSRSTVTDAGGRYLLVGLPPSTYAVRAQAIGHRPVEKRGLRLQIGAELIVDFSLEASAIEVAEIPVIVEQTPLVDAAKTGVSTTVGQERIEGLPTNGRNFTDFIGLSPTFVKRPGFGAGAQAGSLGGARDNGVVIQMDGVQNSGTFFGGDPRGSDRLPIAFSIEAVKEFQVLTNEYDVSKGGFTGGIVNAVTKSGSNEFHGTFFEYFRNQNFTNEDFLGVDPTLFRSHQFGTAISGPVIKDKVFFFGAVDRQARQQPITAISPTVTGIADSTLRKLDSIIRNVYTVDPGQTGTYSQINNEWVLFGRLDWNISQKHRLALRDSYTSLDASGDRIAANNPFDYSSNGGPLHPKSNSLVLNLFSNVTPALFNELRFQSATDKKPRPSEVNFPQVRVTLGTGRVIALGADSIIQYNNLEEKTLQFADIISYNRGAHSIQVGTDNIRYKFFNLFFNNGLGTYTFNWGNDRATLDSLAAGHASHFTRAVPFRDSSGVQVPISPVAFPDSIPTAGYVAWNYSAFIQDKWQATSRLTVQAGLRLDIPKVSGTPRNNPYLLDSFPQFFLDSAGIARIRGGTGTAADSITTGREVAARHNWAPRVGLVYDVYGDRRTVLRGGAGYFYGYTPFVFWSNMFLNTGRDQLVVSCDSLAVATRNVDLNADAPIQCGALAAPIADAFFFGKDYTTPYAFKWNLGFDHSLTPNLVIGGELAYAKTYDNYSNADLNFRTDNPRILSGEGGRMVVGNAPGAGSSVRRLDPRFARVLIHENQSRADYTAVIGSMRYRAGPWDVSGSYTYSRNRDDYSRSCCTSSSQWQAIESGTNLPTDLRGNFGTSDNDTPHTIVLSVLWRAPYGISVSGIWRTASGRPYSPMVNSVDANGDGTSGNDRAYIPRNRNDISIDGNGGAAGVGTAAQQDSAYAVLDNIINTHSCLNTQRGRIAARNSCRNPARSVLDIKMSRKIATLGGQELELMADFFNVLNGINSKWGRWTSAGTGLMRARSFDAVNDRYVYEVNSGYAQKFLEFGGNLAQFQVQFGARYRF